MKKVTLPAPPQPASTQASPLHDAAPRRFRDASPQGASTREFVARPDGEFLSRTFSRALWLGTVMTMAAAWVTRDGGIGISVGIGVALSLALLKSQEVLIHRATRHLDDARVRREYSRMDLQRKIAASMPLLLLGLGKYGFVGAMLALAISQNWFSMAAFACGFALLHFVLMARAAGALLAARVRPVGEVYARQIVSSTHGS